MPVAWYRLEADGTRLLLTLHVQPGAKRTEVVGLHGDALKLRVASPPAGGRANAAVVAYLASVFGVPLRDVTLLQGESSRRKLIEIRGPTLDPARLH